jgi:hypothetical protein
MKNRILRSISAILILVLLIPSLAACSEAEEKPGGLTASEPAAAETAAATETEAEEIPGTEEAATAEMAAVAAETPVSVETPVPTPGAGADTWLIMLYFDADDPALEKDIFFDLNEAERVGSSEKVSIVAQIDRYDGEFTGEQDFTTAKRFYLTQDDDLNVINSEEIADLGEVNMSDAQTLIDFSEWAIKTYPANHHVLIMSDHGAGWPGGWSDPAPENDVMNSLLFTYDDMLYTVELDGAYKTITESTGIGKFDIIGYDACLMAGIEALTSLAPYSQYAVLSEEIEPGMGWAYTSFLQKLIDQPEMSAADLAAAIVDSYIVGDSIVVDDEVRANYIKTYYNQSLSEEQLKGKLTDEVTLTAVDLSALPNLLSALDNLAQAMTGIDQEIVAGARSHTRSYYSVFGDDNPPPYIDLGNFAQIIKEESGDEAVSAAADEIQTAIGQAVIAEMHGKGRESSNGVSFYFPNSGVFEGVNSDHSSYTSVAERFSQESLWDDFLLFHYQGVPLGNTGQPAPGLKGSAPGASKITISPIEASADTASEGQPATLSTTITGKKIAYIYIFTGRFNPDESVEVVDLDFIDAEKTKNVGGMVYPEWGGSDVPIDFDWEPVEYFLNDGKNSVSALLEPETYGVGSKDTVYTVDGLYTLGKEKSKHFARVYFDSDGSLVRIMGFIGEKDSGPMHEITPQIGDQFTVYKSSIPADENAKEDFISSESGTLTFDGTPWTWDSGAAPAGDYVVGFIAEDMDGNTYEEYTGITVNSPYAANRTGLRSSKVA